MNDPVLIAKLAGAVVVFVLGIWIGLGMPGLKRRSETKSWRAADRYRATWINRMFFKMDNAPRRFDSSRLILPKDNAEKAVGHTREGEEESGNVARL
jgi:hypothetical protein